MKIAVQVVDQATGHRTGVNSMERADLAAALHTLPDKERYLVLIIMEESGEGWEFSVAPFYSVEQFISYFDEGYENG